MTNIQIIAIEKAARNITEDIHTYAKWKSLGYQVRRGEKSTIKFPIWKYATKKKQDEESDNEETTGRMFMKMSAFFTESQVEPIQKN